MSLLVKPAWLVSGSSLLTQNPVQSQDSLPCQTPSEGCTVPTVTSTVSAQLPDLTRYLSSLPHAQVLHVQLQVISLDWPMARQAYSVHGVLTASLFN